MDWLTLSEAAMLLGIKPKTLAKKVKRGEIYHPERYHRHYRFARQWIEDYLLGKTAAKKIGNRKKNKWEDVLK